MEHLDYNPDGTIQKVVPTLRGVGIGDASREIQIDRYSAVSPEGVSVAFLNDANTFEGWKTVMTTRGAWISFQ